MIIASQSGERGARREVRAGCGRFCGEKRPEAARSSRHCLTGMRKSGFPDFCVYAWTGLMFCMRKPRKPVKTSINPRLRMHHRMRKRKLPETRAYASFSPEDGEGDALCGKQTLNTIRYFYSKIIVWGPSPRQIKYRLRTSSFYRGKERVDALLYQAIS